MKTIYAILALSVSWIEMTGSVSGQILIPADDPTFGPNSLTVDTRTGLTWLDLPFSVNYSYDEAEAATQPGGVFQGFRHATVEEVLSLYNSAGLEEGLVAQTAPNYPNALALMQMIGITDTSPNGAVAAVGISGTVNSNGLALAPFIGTSSFNNVDGIMVTTSRQLPGTYSALYGLNDSVPTVGNWLVEVPEPSSSTLLLSILVLLKRKQIKAFIDPR